MNHLMIDIETLGTAIGSAIANIGAVVFNEEKILQEWECRIDLASCFKNGLTFDAKTIVWWMEQSKEAQHATFVAGIAVDIDLALTSLNEFIADEDVKRVWSHGATFDIPMLVEAARRCNLDGCLPHYASARDTRTLYELADVNPKEFMTVGGTAHSAIDDARAQALAVIASWDKLRAAPVFVGGLEAPRARDFGVMPEPMRASVDMLPPDSVRG